MRYVEPILALLRRYPVETGLISLAILISIISFIPRSHASEPEVQGATAIQSPSKDVEEHDEIEDLTLSVEVSGAVLYPDVYLVAPGTNMKDLIDMAGGLTSMADHFYVGRNYNLARLVGDQEKIYIPYVWDIQNGTFYEQNRVLEYLQPLYLNNDKAPLPEEGGLTISINDASLQELDTLPGIGLVTAQKILDSRPYTTIDELVNKKVMNQSTFESLRELIKL
ncbi:MAG: helix-hairpin-helix domain-containing protein [bacterium]|nr:helix-hairpin-helix domain-containing protein [bacterium]